MALSRLDGGVGARSPTVPFAGFVTLFEGIAVGDIDKRTNERTNRHKE